MRILICFCGEEWLYLPHIMRRIHQYIYQRKDWPNFVWQNNVLLSKLSEVRNKQGLLLGKMESLGFPLRENAILNTLTLDVLKSTEIEGEFLNADQVRSSVARRLGMEIAGLVPADRHVDGVVEMLLDATQNYKKPLSKKRLLDWHAALFPTGRSGMHSIIVANWRNDKNGPMQVVSGAMGKEKVHYQAPDAQLIDREIKQFIKWFNEENQLEPVIKSAIAHFWFITVHLFEDGNGRIARAIADMQLARADGSNQRFYSMSAQIRLERNAYYEILENTQKGTVDITNWLLWFLDCLLGSLKATEKTLASVLSRAKFWEQNVNMNFNERQRLMLTKLLDDFFGNLTTTKWAKICKCSQDTALRDIQNLLNKNILKKEDAGGRSTNYVLNL